MFLLALLGGCDECHRTQPLERWCAETGLEDVVCEIPTADEVQLDYRCGRWDVAAYGWGFSSETWYFDAETGEAVAVELHSDVASACDPISLDARYGRRIWRCEPECSHSAEEDLLPLCD